MRRGVGFQWSEFWRGVRVGSFVFLLVWIWLAVQGV